jgi:hypothetical protein
LDDAAPSAEPKRLKLRAIDDEDLAVLAAFLQDAIVSVSEMAYLPQESRFALAVCRFRWEAAVGEKPDDLPEDVFERVTCAVTIDAVREPKYRGFSLKERTRLMPLLTATYEDGAVLLTFGGGAALKLAVDRLDFRMEDFGVCWPTRQKPEHDALHSEPNGPET